MKTDSVQRYTESDFTERQDLTKKNRRAPPPPSSANPFAGESVILSAAPSATSLDAFVPVATLRHRDIVSLPGVAFSCYRVIFEENSGYSIQWRAAV
jgi:hypothetical protein